MTGLVDDSCVTLAGGGPRAGRVRSRDMMPGLAGEPAVRFARAMLLDQSIIQCFDFDAARVDGFLKMRGNGGSLRSGKTGYLTIRISCYSIYACTIAATCSRDTSDVVVVQNLEAPRHVSALPCSAVGHSRHRQGQPRQPAIGLADYVASRQYTPATNRPIVIEIRTQIRNDTRKVELAARNTALPRRMSPATCNFVDL